MGTPALGAPIARSATGSTTPSAPTTITRSTLGKSAAARPHPGTMTPSRVLYSTTGGRPENHPGVVHQAHLDQGDYHDRRDTDVARSSSVSTSVASARR